jgi:hypothetical protein
MTLEAINAPTAIEQGLDYNLSHFEEPIWFGDNDFYHHNVEKGHDFILNHFQEPIFPRKIITKDLGHQKEVFNKQEGSG